MLLAALLVLVRPVHDQFSIVEERQLPVSSQGICCISKQIIDAGALVLVQVYEEGTHLMVPWFERPVIYDVRARPNVITSTSGSRDLQMVSSVCCLHQPRPQSCCLVRGATCRQHDPVPQTGVGLSCSKLLAEA